MLEALKATEVDVPNAIVDAIRLIDQAMINKGVEAVQEAEYVPLIQPNLFGELPFMVQHSKELEEIADEMDVIFDSLEPPISYNKTYRYVRPAADLHHYKTQGSCPSCGVKHEMYNNGMIRGLMCMHCPYVIYK